MLECQDSNGAPFLLASFHGDTNGLATVPVVSAVHAAHEAYFPKHHLVFGLDANTYSEDTPKSQNIQKFVDFYHGIGIESAWGPTVDDAKITTFNARTFLQTQLNKAVKLSEKDIKGDRN